MAIVPPDYNNGPNGWYPPVNESLTATPETSIPTPSPAQLTGDATAGIAESVSDYGTAAIPDIGLTSGINVDSLFSIAGEISNPFGDLSINGIGGPLNDAFGANFDIDSIADQFGIGGLLGNLPIGINTNIAPPLEPAQNVLHNYASYTYRITLGAQDIQDHQAIASEDFIIGTPKITTMIMSSGGAHSVDGVTRDPIFKEDFYINDLKMTTIIGASARGNGSNTVGITFTIVEPYAVSLIERLLALAEKLNYKNYIEIPFVFKIEFVGYNDAGDMIGLVPQTTKYIPFRLTYMKFEVKGQGSMYECTAIPVNHFTFNQTVEAIPEAVEVAAGNVGEFFNGKPIPVGNGNNTIGGVVNAVNGFHRKLANTSGEDAQKNSARNAYDKIRIVVHPDIAKHKLEVGNLSKVGMLKEGAPGNVHIDPSKPTYGFHAGTGITALIRDTIKNSTFWTEQIKEHKRIDDANAAEAFSKAEGRAGAGRTEEKAPLIKPSITARYKMLNYDEKANRHAYEATYIVAPYETAGQQSASVGRSEIENVAKEYNYLFTGKNQDILNLDIKFDLAFYNNAVVNTESVTEGTPAGNNKVLNGNDEGDNLTHNQDAITKTPIEKRPPTSIENIGTASKEDKLKMKASALERSIMNSSSGDMITLDLTILGDPSFIKQDDILYADDGDQSNGYTFNGSIKQDNGDMYLRLKFKTFDDIDHNTGLRIEDRQIPFSSFTRRSTFDGFYRIMMLDNTFKDGEFTQDLVVVRTYVQDTDNISSDGNTNLDSNLVSFGFGFGDQGGGEFGDTFNAATDAVSGAVASADAFVGNAREQAIAGATGVVNGLTPAASVDEAKALSGDFYANQTPIDANEFAFTDESLISNVTPIPNAESIADITTQTPLNADINSRRRR